MITSGTPHTNTVDVGEDLVEATQAGLFSVETGLVALIGLIVTPPLLTLAVAVAIPTLAVFAVVAAVVGVIAVPVALVRRVRAHHREHGSTLFIHRVVPRSGAEHDKPEQLGRGTQ